MHNRYDYAEFLLCPKGYAKRYALALTSCRGAVSFRTGRMCRLSGILSYVVSNNIIRAVGRHLNPKQFHSLSGS
jgi:hypothetical protein